MKKIKIGNKFVGDVEPCLISFEPSATYTTFEEAKEMIKASALSGADAVKFQTFLPGDSDRMMGDKEITVEFLTPSGKKKELVYDAFKRRELSKEQWKKLRDFAKELNIIFISSPYFFETVDFLNELKVDAIKVSKGDINNVLLIDKISKTNIPVILDGREKFEDVERAINICKKNMNEQIIIMHCPSGYPAENAGVHLSAIKAIKETFGFPVGFADHSPGDSMNYAAIALGVSMLEKTISPNKMTEHVEHYMSLELNELQKFVEGVRSIEKAMGDPKILWTSRVAEKTRRSLVVNRDVKRNEKITLDMLDFKRPENAGISCSY